MKLLSSECSQTAKDHHTLTLMSSKGGEIKITVLCGNCQSDTEMALETVELLPGSEVVLPSVMSTPDLASHFTYQCETAGGEICSNKDTWKRMQEL